MSQYWVHAVLTSMRSSAINGGLCGNKSAQMLHKCAKAAGIVIVWFGWPTLQFQNTDVRVEGLSIVHRLGWVCISHVITLLPASCTMICCFMYSFGGTSLKIIMMIVGSELYMKGWEITECSSSPHERSTHWWSYFRVLESWNIPSSNGDVLLSLHPW